MMRGWRTTTALLLAVALSGCSDLFGLWGNLVPGEPNIDSNVWLLHSDAASADESGFMPPACTPLLDDAKSTGTTSSAADAAKATSAAINLCTDAMKTLIDVRWSKLETDLMTLANGSGFGFDLGNLAVSAAGTLAPLATTKTILSAINSGLTGTRASLDQNYLRGKTIDILLLQMRQDRACWANVIAQQERNNSYKNMYEAANDLYAYNRAGSYPEAIISMQSNVGAQATANQAALQTTKTGGTTTGGTTGNTGTGTAGSASSGSASPAPVAQPAVQTCGANGNPPKQQIVIQTAAGSATLPFADGQDPVAALNIAVAAVNSAVASADATIKTIAAGAAKNSVLDPTAPAPAVGADPSTLADKAKTDFLSALGGIATAGGTPSPSTITTRDAYNLAIANLQISTTAAAMKSNVIAVQKAQLDNGAISDTIAAAKSTFDTTMQTVTAKIKSITGGT